MDYLGGPNAITKVLSSARGKQKTTREKGAWEGLDQMLLVLKMEKG